MKKILSVAISAVLVFYTSFSMIFACSTSGHKEYGKLRFNEDGNFKILQITDIQDGIHCNEAVKDMIRESVIKENPDIVVLTGDNTSGDSCGAGLIKAIDKKTYKIAVDQFMSIFEELEVPVAAVFGNHDDECLLSKEEIMDYYESYDCFVGEDEGDSLYGCGTYNVPVYSSIDDSKMAYNLWMIDSNTYDTELGGYDYVHDDQVDWYVEKSNEIKAENDGNVVKSMVFQHIIVREVLETLSYSDVETENSVYDNNQYVSINNDYYKTGDFAEMPCPSQRYDKEFSSMKSQGDVVAMFFGHDHCNSFELSYQGIDLVATPAVRFGSYSSEERGIRVININENNTDEYETHLIHWADVFPDSFIAQQHYDMYAKRDNFWEKVKAGFLYIIMLPIKVIFGYAF